MLQHIKNIKLRWKQPCKISLITPPTRIHFGQGQIAKLRSEIAGKMKEFY